MILKQEKILYKRFTTFPYEDQSTGEVRFITSIHDYKDCCIKFIQPGTLLEDETKIVNEGYGNKLTVECFTVNFIPEMKIVFDSVYTSYNSPNLVTLDDHLLVFSYKKNFLRTNINYKIYNYKEKKCISEDEFFEKYERASEDIPKSQPIALSAAEIVEHLRKNLAEVDSLRSCVKKVSKHNSH